MVGGSSLLRLVKRTRGGNGSCGATKTPSPTRETHKGRVTAHPQQRSKEFFEARKGDLKNINGVLESSDFREQGYLKD